MTDTVDTNNTSYIPPPDWVLIHHYQYNNMQIDVHELGGDLRIFIHTLDGREVFSHGTMTGDKQNVIFVMSNPIVITKDES